MDMVNIEMIFHAKALELFTQCYQGLADISEEDDLEVWRQSAHCSGSVKSLKVI